MIQIHILCILAIWLPKATKSYNIQIKIQIIFVHKKYCFIWEAEGTKTSWLAKIAIPTQVPTQEDLSKYSLMVSVHIRRQARHPQRLINESLV